MKMTLTYRLEVWCKGQVEADIYEGVENFATDTSCLSIYLPYEKYAICIPMVNIESFTYQEED